MIEILFKSLKNEKLETLDSYKPGCWVNVISPDAGELEKVASDLGLDINTIKDALDPYEVSRVERENGSVYIFARTPITVSGMIQTSPLLIVVTPDYLVTIGSEAVNISAKYKNSTVGVPTTQKTKFFLTLMLDINANYSHVINDTRKKFRNYSADVINVSNKDIVQLVYFESVFNDLLSSLEPLAITFSQLLSGKFLKLYENDQDLVEDLQIGTDQSVRLCRANIKSIINIREAYASIISNNLNKTVKILTAVTLILTIPTAVASFFGMNVTLPLAQHPLAFLFIVMLTGFLTVATWIVFWRKDYL